jgi:hypothetical protein
MSVYNVLTNEERQRFFESQHPNVRNLFKKFKKEERLDPRDEASRLFFLNEVDFLGMVPQTLFDTIYGHPTDIFVGEYTHHRGIYVRESTEGQGTALIAPEYGWLFDVRTDCAEKGLFHKPQMSMNHCSLQSIQESLPTIENIVRMIESYESLVEARRFESTK